MNTLAHGKTVRCPVWLIVLGFVGLCVVIACSVYVVFFKINNQRISAIVGNQSYSLRVATDEASRRQGLSGVENLSKNQGLLMVFPEAATHAIWMKDMKIPLDCLWLDEQKTVVYIVENAQPEWSTNKILVPSQPALYVVELPAGTVKDTHISLGHTVQFNLTEQAV